jgi:hypothetical protein
VPAITLFNRYKTLGVRVKFRLLFCLVSYLFLVGILSGCGPEGTRHDEVDRVHREQEQKSKKTIEPAVGTYNGTFTNPVTGDVLKARLQVAALTILVSNPSGGEISRIPTLGGNLAVFVDDQPNSEMAVGVYSAGDFSPDTHEINLYGSGGNATGSQYSFTGHLDDDDISGLVNTPFRVGMKFQGHRN